MKPVLMIMMAGLVVACAASAKEPIELSAAAQAQLDEEISGRTAGPAASCVHMRDIRQTRTIAEGVMLFEGVGDILWVNTPGRGCSALRHGRAFRTVTPSTSLCSGDIVTIFDPVSGIEFGGCNLEEFVPYRRAG